MYYPISIPQQEDVAALLEHLQVVSIETDNLLLPPNMPDLTENSVSQALRPNADTATLIVRDGEKIIGLAQLFRSIWPKTRHRANVVMSVRQTYWGQRIATSMTQRLEQIALDMGISQIELAVQADNLHALTLYERCGFMRVCTYPDFFQEEESGTYTDAYLMRKPVF